MTDDQIIALAHKHGFLGALDVTLDRASAIQFARLVIDAYERVKRSRPCQH